MRFDPDFKPELCVSKDTTRTAGITAVHLDVEGKRLLSTDGSTLSIIPCEVEPGDVSGPIPVDVIKAARKAKHPDGVVILCGKDLKIPPDGPTFPRPDVGAFPDVDRVVPRHKAGDPDTFEVAFNPSLLLAVAKAIGGGEGVRVVFGTKNYKGAWAADPLLLSNGARPGVIGVCMPMGAGADGGAPKGLGGGKAETQAELSRNAEKVADLEAEVKAL